MKTQTILQSGWLRVAVLVLMTAITITFHYQGMGHSDMVLRGLFRQFCYLPILLAALWFGLTGALINAAAIVLVVAPFMFTRHPTSSALAQEGLEYVYYFLFGGVFGYLVDREKQAQKKREELNRRIARMEHMSAIGELAAGLAHEIKNPMGSIKGAAEIIEPDIPEDHPKREFVDVLIEEVDRLNCVVEDFLNYAKPLTLRREKLHISEELEAVAKQARMSQKEKNVDFSVSGSEDLIIEADRGLLRQVFLNLALNALQSTPDGTEVKIRAKRADGTVTVEFEDSGPGVPDDEKKKIFMPFYTSRETGSGLGLTITERIVMEHGGKIDVEDARGGGAIFRITLPEVSE